ncbi:hypothetical protein [Planctobacterium marinum]|uniref:hypothetical protein n=1 Tax=Planctobacterium marinum TaxID=1631968 RepID=UPI001E2A04BB|nr:hypothetical protein [Planctobacterium marinum]MCC2604102.1 hypothetical protein [Planctobacterium marinum]
MITIYYDNDGAGVNATCSDWPCRNEWFNSMSELRDFLTSEYGTQYQLTEITPKNYPELCKAGVFDE